MKYGTTLVKYAKIFETNFGGFNICKTQESLNFQVMY